MSAADTTEPRISKKKDITNAAPVSRRGLFKLGAAIAIPLMSKQAFAAVELKSGTNAFIPIDRKDEIIKQTCSTFDCGGKCFIKAHVREGRLTRINTRFDNELDPQMPIMRGCLRGRSYRRFVYHPDRLKYPMKRIGKRGEGKFERISWEEAVSIITDKLTTITEKYGPASRYLHNTTAVSSATLPGSAFLQRFLNMTGGYLPYYHSVSLGNTLASTPYTYGVAATGSSHNTLTDTKLVILWGHNPAETIFGHTNYYFQQMKQNGTKFIVVDPRYSDSAASYAHEWIPLLPTTDNALMDAMMHTIIAENLHDKEFLDTYCLGFDENHMPDGVPENESLLSYLFGQKDGIVKNAEWAEKITKVPSETIKRLAREYATTKPAALIQGWGPQRHICGERSGRGATLLAALTGNVGKRGAWASGYGGDSSRLSPVGIDIGENPVKSKISIMNWVDACNDASKITPEMGLVGEPLTSNIKMLFCLAGNYLANQNPDLNASIEMLKDESKIECIVVSDLYMSPSAKFADILLPETSFLERWNLGETWGTANYFILSEKMIDPFFEARDDYDWISDVAEKLGIKEKFTEGRNGLQDWVKYSLQKTKEALPQENIPSFDELLKKRWHRFTPKEHIAFKEQIEDPANHPFPTPSGKIELFSKRLYDMNNPDIPALSHYVPAIEGPEDPLTKKYPLQMITWKSLARANSTFYLNPWTNAAKPHCLWINPIDAKARGIRQGSKVKIFNDRGATLITAEVTPRIIPGVVAMPTGAWWKPDAKNPKLDHGGCPNVLTSTRITPLAKGNSHQTLLVDVALS